MQKKARFVLFFVLLMASPVYGADKGNIAVAGDGKTAAAQVSGEAARAPYFLIFDRSGALVEAVENPHKEAARRAGASVVPFLAKKGVTFIVAGNFGKHMIQAMQSQGMQYVEFQGSAEAALNKVLEGGQ